MLAGVLGNVPSSVLKAWLLQRGDSEVLIHTSFQGAEITDEVHLLIGEDVVVGQLAKTASLLKPLGTIRVWGTSSESLLKNLVLAGFISAESSSVIQQGDLRIFSATAHKAEWEVGSVAPLKKVSLCD